MAIGISKTKSKTSVEKKVVFEYYAPQAKKVELAGTFNGWDASRHPLKKDRQGKWKGEVVLPSGRYEYRYWVDDTWQNDQNPVECVPNPYGTWNCVLKVQ
jgi:1,4-alpha-glucan branching enzyme